VYKRQMPAARAGRPVAGAGAGTVAAPVETEQTAPGPAEEPTPSLSERIAELFTAVIEDPEAAVAVTGDTDFFMVGGNSLGAVRLMRRLKAELGVSVRLRDFLLAPTPDGLRALVEKAGAE
uniref:acyl carrier protein n=1 Tax=Streptomyces sp. wa13 TaxID=1828236 RepID=UPI003C7A29AA